SLEPARTRGEEARARPGGCRAHGCRRCDELPARQASHGFRSPVAWLDPFWPFIDGIVAEGSISPTQSCFGGRGLPHPLRVRTCEGSDISCAVGEVLGALRMPPFIGSTAHVANMD